jgi:hypothetical protein
MLSKIAICFFLLTSSVSFAQVTIIKDNILKAGRSQANSVPYIVNAPDTVLYKAESEIVLGPNNTISVNDEFYTSGYTTSTTGYFHAYLVPPVSYAEMKIELDASYAVTIENKIYFKYIERYNDIDSLEFQIYDYKRNKMLAHYHLPIPKIGPNYYEIDLKGIQTFKNVNLSTKANQFFVLEVKNSKGRTEYLRFKFNRTL